MFITNVVSWLVCKKNFDYDSQTLPKITVQEVFWQRKNFLISPGNICCISFQKYSGVIQNLVGQFSTWISPVQPFNNLSIFPLDIVIRILSCQFHASGWWINVACSMYEPESWRFLIQTRLRLSFIDSWTTIRNCILHNRAPTCRCGERTDGNVTVCDIKWFSKQQINL